jgi:hypothetical protein
MTQEQRIIKILKETGRVTRNQCLSMFPAITRLGAIICDLNKKGWKFRTEYLNNDYIYTATTSPEPKNSPYSVVNPKASLDDLDNQIKAILIKIKPSWENYKTIDELNKALKSKYNTTKIDIIKKYSK